MTLNGSTTQLSLNRKGITMTANRNSKGRFETNAVDCRTDKRDMSEQLAELHEKLHADRLDVVEYVNNLPGNIRRQVLFSLVGSLNASLIGTAQTMIRRIEKDQETTILDLSPGELEHLMTGPDWVEGTSYARNVNAIAQMWRDDLVALTDQPHAGSLSETIEFMVRSPRQLDDALLKATLEAAGIADVPTTMLKAKYNIQQAQRSDQLAQQRGHIEWIIDQALNPEHSRVSANMFDLIEGEYTEPNFFNLSEDQQEAMTSKLANALERTRDTAILGVLNRDRRWSFGDLPIIQAAIAEVKQHA
jgi:hypothetical protein